MTTTLVREIVSQVSKEASGSAYPGLGASLFSGKGGFMQGKGRPLGSVNDFPRCMHGIGAGMSFRLGEVGKQTMVYFRIPSGVELKPIKTYPEGRRCVICGCLLSIYNHDNKCSCHMILGR